MKSTKSAVVFHAQPKGPRSTRSSVKKRENHGKKREDGKEGRNLGAGSGFCT